MDTTTLQDRVSRGLGVAARRVGAETDAYRPNGPDNPLDRANRFLRLSTAFMPLDGKFTRPSGYGNALWVGVFDHAYTRPGDFLVQEAGTWFVAAQQPLLPILCVRADRVISLSRPSAPGGIGVNAYGGVALTTAVSLLRNWPASLLSTSAGSRPTAELPADGLNATWNVLLPAIEGVVLRPADLLTDDLSRTGVVASAELTDLGWRLVVRQSST